MRNKEIRDDARGRGNDDADGAGGAGVGAGAGAAAATRCWFNMTIARRRRALAAFMAALGLASPRQTAPVGEDAACTVPDTTVTTPALLPRPAPDEPAARGKKPWYPAQGSPAPALDPARALASQSLNTRPIVRLSLPYGPPVNEVADTSVKANFVESKQPAKEPTPPPHYSVNSLSKVQTIVSSAPTNASPAPSSTKDNEENSEAVFRVIKPLPQRRDKRTSVAEQKSLLQTPLPPSLYEKSAEPVAQQVKDGKDDEAVTSKPVQLFVFPKSDINVENNVAVASSSTTMTTTTTQTTTTETATASIALGAKTAGTTTIFDRLAASNPHPVSTSTPATPVPVPNPTPAPIPTPAPTPPRGNPYLNLALRPAPTNPTTPANTSAPLPTAKSVILRPDPPKTTTDITPPKPEPQAAPSPGVLCPKCSSPNTPLITQTRNLNHLRPYHLCSNTSCRSWNGFTDTRGLDRHQQCDCSPSYPMRLVAMNKTDQWGRRQAFWSCQYKACSAWGVCLDDEGDEKWFSRGEVEAMVEDGRI
ncbi:hypothetical protein yc1106_03003 [Curvularia clavata]|uniref:GRF-like zinc ribbon domain-containing protein n=1 Tax=Curvularia clavata TaxID=95742 RepID=A0A9Q9DRH4_CURCL|nr:hypothetical protein yc1106_03003 [Curvularia clavata]